MNNGKVSLIGRIVVPFIFLVVCKSSLAQSVEDYYEKEKFIHSADSLYDMGEYKESSCMYTKAFKTNVAEHSLDWYRYKLATAYSLSDQKDLAFKQLDFLASGKSIYKEILAIDRNQLESDSSFNVLHEDKRWKKLLLSFEHLTEDINNAINSAVAEQINSLGHLDQEARSNYRNIKDEYGIESIEYKKAGEELRILDSVNLSIIDSISKIYGWPGVDLIGMEASFNLFLIVQHTDVMDQERYLPLINESIAKGKTMPGIRPFLVDRIELHKNGLQVFGTQTCMDKETKEWYVCPIQDPDKLNDRRVVEGMMSFSEELERDGIIWSLDEYKQKLPNYIKVYNRDTR